MGIRDWAIKKLGLEKLAPPAIEDLGGESYAPKEPELWFGGRRLPPPPSPESCLVWNGKEWEWSNPAETRELSNPLEEQLRKMQETEEYKELAASLAPATEEELAARLEALGEGEEELEEDEDEITLPDPPKPHPRWCFREATEEGKEPRNFYIYAESQEAAVALFRERMGELPVSLPELDTEKWSTSLIEGRRAPGA